MKKSIGSLILLIFCICLSAAESDLRPYKLVNADSMIVKKVNDEYVSNLKGNVHFFYGETEFFTDYADIYEEQKVAKMAGNVKVYDDTLSLFAQRMEYNHINEILRLFDHVFAQETHADSTIRTFEADRAVYRRREREFHAYDDVKSYDERENVHGSCGKLSYYMERGYGYLIMQPHLVMSGKDTLEITAEKIEYFQEYEKVVANFDVVTQSNEFRMNSDFLLYFNQEEKAVYLGNPRFSSDYADARAVEF
ncbi:MAG TPA: LptA/OstA family protein, partial [Candidatus Cloacimonadota bacterium]|nr:LptA/OstA family protein [Candidatus Cloacimonadota bacterium]